MLEYLEDRCTPSVTVTKSFMGLKMGDPGNDAIPPDVNGAAGPDRVIETVNSFDLHLRPDRGVAVNGDSGWFLRHHRHLRSARHV